MKRLILLLAILLSGVYALHAQDKLYIKSQRNPIDCEIVEVGTSEVKYHLVGRTLPVITMDKEDVVKIVYKNGEQQVFADPLKDFTLYTGQKRWNGKISLLTPLLGYTQLYLEHAEKPGRSSEYMVNIIGLGKRMILDQNYNYNNNTYHNTYFDARGLGLGYGIKFVRLPDFSTGRVRLRHLMQGSYLKPEVSGAYYTRNFMASGVNGQLTYKRMPVYGASLGLSLGRQWVLDNSISVDLYGSVGFALDNVRRNMSKAITDTRTIWYFDDTTPYNGFGYTRFSSGDLGLGLAAGLKVGYLFDLRKKNRDTGRGK